MNKLQARKSRKKSSETNNNKIIFQLVFATILNFISALILCVIFYFGGIDVASNYFIILTVLCGSLFLTAYSSGRKFRKKGILIGVIYNLPFTILSVFLSLIISDFTFDSRMFISVVLMIFISALGGIVSVNTKARHHK